jgi:short-subunit dehydrogenase
MENKKNNVALVTGASSGIGKSTVLQLLKDGYIVYGAARRMEKMSDLKTAGAHILSMDVTDDASMVSGIQRIITEQGRIDVLVNNAGYGSYGAVEDVPIEEAKRQFEVNIFGLARLTQLVLPHMRSTHFGKIINISSIGGKIYTPLGAWYHGTKHALEGFSDCLRLETKSFGIDVIIIEPGAIQTEWGDIALDNMRKTSGNGAYKNVVAGTIKMFQNSYKKGSSSTPDVIASAISKALKAKRPKTRYAAGANAKPIIFLRWLLSDRIFDKTMLMMMK